MNQERIDEALELLETIISESYPSLDTRNGTVVHDLLMGLTAIGYGFLYDHIDSFTKTNSISSITEENTSLDDASVNALLSNWFLTRNAGSFATGPIKIIFDTKKKYTIPANTIFSFGTLKFKNLEEVIIESDSLTQEAGQYFYVMNIQADSAGESYRLVKNTYMETVLYPLNIVSITVSSDFTGGTNTETSTELLDRAKVEIGTRDLVSKRSIQNFLSYNFSEIKKVLVLGYNDRELVRIVNDVGIRISGACDILIDTNTILNQDILLTTDSNGSVIVPKEYSPIARINGIYKKNYPENQIAYTITYGSYNVNYDSVGARYSQYEKITLLTDAITSDIIINVDRVEIVKEVDDYLHEPNYENIVCDQLVKTFMPCFIKINLTYKTIDNVDIDETAFKQHIIDFIGNYTDDDNIFYVSRLISNLLSFSNILSVTTPLSITGVYNLPDGSQNTIVSDNKLSIPSDYNIGYSNRTFAYYIDSTDISLTKEE